MEIESILISINGKNKNISDALNVPTIKDLFIRGFVIEDKELYILNKLENLESISFEDCIFNTEKYINTNIKVANFYLCQDLYTQMLEKAPNLERLVIRKCGNVNLKGIIAMPKLKKLYLQNQLGVDMSHIENSTLEYVNLDGSNLFNEANIEYPFKVVHKERSIL